MSRLRIMIIVIRSEIEVVVATHAQVEKSFGNTSVWSAVESIAAVGSTTHRVAVYKGLKVAVYAVNKSDISLGRHDLVELITVSDVSIMCLFSRLFLGRGLV